jgi:ABC-2 type transport system permease protein
MKLFSILKKDLLILVRSRAEMLVLFLMPLAFILPISFALGSGDGYGIGRSNQMVRLPVVNLDGGPHAQVLMSAVGESLRLEIEFDAVFIRQLALDKDPACAPVMQANDDAPILSSAACSDKAARAMLQRGWRSAILIIPAGFSQAVDDGEQAAVELLYDPTADSIAMQQIEGVVRGATIKVSLQNQVGRGLAQLNDLTLFAPPNVRQTVEEQPAQSLAPARNPALRLVKVAPENYRANRTPDTYQQTIPGYAVMYVFFIVTTLSASIHQEKVHGTFRRLLTTPVGRAEMLAGKMLATMTVGLVQVIVLFIVGAVFFRLGLGRDPIAFLLLTVVLVATAAAIGLAVSTTRMRGAGVGALLVISAVIGGCMFPLDLMPAFLRNLSYIVPHSWALIGYQNLLVRDQGIQEVMPQIGALLGFALLFFLIAVRRFDFEA